MVSLRPLSRVVGSLPNGLYMAHKLGLIRLTSKTWDDPPSTHEKPMANRLTTLGGLQSW